MSLHKDADFIEDFTVMLKRARDITLKAANDNHAWGKKTEKCWTKWTQFFPLSEAMSDIHKEVFCLRFYKDVSEQEIVRRIGAHPSETRPLRHIAAKHHQNPDGG